MEHWESSHIAIKSCKLVALILHLFSLIGAELSNFGYLDLFCSLTNHGFNILPQRDACTSAMLNIETLHCVHVVVTLQYLQGSFFVGWWVGEGDNVLLSFRFLVQANLLPNRMTKSRWLGTAAARVPSYFLWRKNWASPRMNNRSKHLTTFVVTDDHSVKNLFLQSWSGGGVGGHINCFSFSVYSCKVDKKVVPVLSVPRDLQNFKSNATFECPPGIVVSCQ